MVKQLDEIDSAFPFPNYVSSFLLKFMPSMQKYMYWVKNYYWARCSGVTWPFETMNAKDALGKTFDFKAWETNFRRQYRQHYADLKRNCPEDKVLVMDDINIGWETLCEFVEKPAPTDPWPHANKGGEIINTILIDPDERMPTLLNGELVSNFMKWKEEHDLKEEMEKLEKEISELTGDSAAAKTEVGKLEAMLASFG